MRILVLENDAFAPPGRLTTEAEKAGHQIVVVRLHEGEGIEDVGQYDAIVALGGGMDAYDDDACPFLAGEKRFLVEAVKRSVPVLGICLGSQLLAESLGGRAYRADTSELGLRRPTIEVKDDPVAEALGAFEGFLIHRDTFDIPPGATLIAKTDEFNHAFRFGSALGVQAHPEVEGEIALEWIDSPSDRDIVENAGVDRAALRSQIEAAEPQLSMLAEAFFSAWFAEAEAIIDSSEPT